MGQKLSKMAWHHLRTTPNYFCIYDNTLFFQKIVSFRFRVYFQTLIHFLCRKLWESIEKEGKEVTTTLHHRHLLNSHNTSSTRTRMEKPWTCIGSLSTNFAHPVVLISLTSSKWKHLTEIRCQFHQHLIIATISYDRYMNSFDVQPPNRDHLSTATSILCPLVPYLWHNVSFEQWPPVNNSHKFEVSRTVVV